MPNRRSASPARRTAPAPARSDSTREAAGWAERHFASILAGICFVGLLCRVAILVQYVGSNPLSVVPVNDARVYWQWADQVVKGTVPDDVPYFSAPLYPYLLGVLRVFGGSLTTVYVLQTLAVAAIAVLLAIVCRRRFGAAVGLLAAAFFLLLLEPASASLRLLPGCLQMALVTLLWAMLVAVEAKPTLGRHLAVGAALGSLCLAYAPALLMVPLVAAWMIRRRMVVATVVTVGLFIAPATFHNWRAQGELFLVRAGGGVVLRQGNHPDSNGLLTPLPGVSGHRADMFEQAARIVEQANGRAPTWKQVDAYFRGQALDYWRSDPLRCLRLTATKLYWFVSGRNYGDMYEPRAEIDLGLSTWLRLAPVPTPWLIGPGLVGLVLLARKPVRHWPELMLVGVPVLVAAVFFFSPRFRLPALPMLAVAVAWAIEHGVRSRRHWRTAVSIVVTLGIGILLGPVNRAVGFDVEGPGRTCFNAANGCQRWGDTEAAIRWWRRGLEFTPNAVDKRMTLGDQFANMERLDEALAEYERALLLAPDQPAILARLGETLGRLGRLAEARTQLERAAQLSPKAAEIQYLLGSMYGQLGNAAEARRAFERCLAIDPAEEACRAELEHLDDST